MTTTQTPEGCDAAFDHWYAAQSHQLTNEQVCRLIWTRGWTAALSSSARDQEGVRDEEAERALFEADAEPMGFDLTRRDTPAPEPWDEYADINTGNRWGGWLARAALAGQAKSAAPVCGVCFETEAFTGTCGGGRHNPRALCYKRVAAIPQSPPILDGSNTDQIAAFMHAVPEATASDAQALHDSGALDFIPEAPAQTEAAKPLSIKAFQRIAGRFGLSWDADGCMKISIPFDRAERFLAALGTPPTPEPVQQPRPFAEVVQHNQARYFTCLAAPGVEPPPLGAKVYLAPPAALKSENPSHSDEPMQVVSADPTSEMLNRQTLIDWVCIRWHDEVANRPMINVHRRSLDDSWRQMLRHLGVDDRARLGPTHDELRAEIGSKEWDAMNGTASHSDTNQHPSDPLQCAADWLKSALVDATVADLQRNLMIGHNRAQRLFDAARLPGDGDTKERTHG